MTNKSSLLPNQCLFKIAFAVHIYYTYISNVDKAQVQNNGSIEFFRFIIEQKTVVQQTMISFVSVSKKNVLIDQKL